MAAADCIRIQKQIRQLFFKDGLKKPVPGCSSMFQSPFHLLLMLSVTAALKSLTHAKAWKAKITLPSLLPIYCVKPQPKASLQDLLSLLHVLHLTPNPNSHSSLRADPTSLLCKRENKPAAPVSEQNPLNTSHHDIHLLAVSCQN